MFIRTRVATFLGRHCDSSIAETGEPGGPPSGWVRFLFRLMIVSPHPTHFGAEPTEAVEFDDASEAALATFCTFHTNTRATIEDMAASVKQLETASAEIAGAWAFALSALFDPARFGASFNNNAHVDPSTAVDFVIRRAATRLRHLALAKATTMWFEAALARIHTLSERDVARNHILSRAWVTWLQTKQLTTAARGSYILSRMLCAQTQRRSTHRAIAMWQIRSRLQKGGWKVLRLKRLSCGMTVWIRYLWQVWSSARKWRSLRTTAVQKALQCYLAHGWTRWHLVWKQKCVGILSEQHAPSLTWLERAQIPELPSSADDFDEPAWLREASVVLPAKSTPLRRLLAAAQRAASESASNSEPRRLIEPERKRKSYLDLLEPELRDEMLQRCKSPEAQSASTPINAVMRRIRSVGPHEAQEDQM